MDQTSIDTCRALLDRARTSPDPVVAQHAFREAQRILSRGIATIPHSVIQADQVHPPAAGDYVEPIMAPSRYLVVPGIPAILPNTTATGIRLEFSAGGGWLIGWRGTVVDFDSPGAFAAGPLEQASVGVRMFMNDGEELITNGLGADFARFSDLFADAQNTTPIMRRVDVKDLINFEFRNFQPVGGQTLRPSLRFAFWREKYPGTG